MDYFDDVFHTLQSTGQSQASGFHPKYLNLLQFLSEHVLVVVHSVFHSMMRSSSSALKQSQNTREIVS